MDITNSVTYIYELGLDLLKEDHDKQSILNDLYSIRDQIEGDVAKFLLNNLIEKAEKLVKATPENKQDIIDDIQKFLLDNQEYYKKASTISINVNIEDSPLGIAKGALEMYDLYINHQISMNDFLDKLIYLMAIVQKKGYNKSLDKMLWNLRLNIFCDDHKEIKSELSRLKNFVSNLEKKEEYINRLKVGDIINLLEDNKQYIEIFNIAQGEKEVKKVILFSGICDKNKLITELYYDREVIGLRNRYDELYKNIVLDIIIA